jgi:hypothetical protein
VEKQSSPQCSSAPAASQTSSAQANTQHGDPPFGEWRDGCCDCFNNGVFHPMGCWACWFIPVALGQILTRMKMNAAAEVNAGNGPGNEEYVNTLSILVTLSIFTFIISFSFSVSPPLSTLIFCRIATPCDSWYLLHRYRDQNAKIHEKEI